MLDIIKLNDLREILNLKGLSILSHVNYYTVKNKMLYFRKNQNKGALVDREANYIQEGLEKKACFCQIYKQSLVIA